jgi:hypothetical protein
VIVEEVAAQTAEQPPAYQAGADLPPVVAPTVMTISMQQAEETAQYDAAAERAFSDKPADEAALNSLSHVLQREFDEAEQLRQPTEERWLRDLRQYRGIYDTEVLSELKDRSQAFVRRTRVKVTTTNSRMMDILFPAGAEKNWTVDNTPKPSISEEQRAAIVGTLAQKAGGQKPPDDVVEKAIVDMCKEAAKGMSKVIDDQLTEVRYKQVTRKCIHSGNLYGTGVLKGPLVERRVRQRFQMQGKKWAPKAEEYLVPFVEAVPLWRFYPDMAATEQEQCRFIYERHSMTKHEMSALSRRRTFKRQAILDYLAANPKGQIRTRTYDNELKSLGERDAANIANSGMYEVLERWGWVDGTLLAQAGVDVPQARIHESFFTNIWMLPNGEVIKAVIQPINGVTWPYHIYYFDKDETSIFGEGLASIMRDDQEMLNAAVRMMLDNGALTSGPMLEIALDELATTDKADEVFPWKIWFRKKAGDLSKPAIRQIQLENNLEWLQKMAAMFEQNTDEVTAIPRYMTGENPTQGAAGTASGMSMLMGAANIVIKELINAWDEGVTRTFITALYRWNMQFHKDNSIKGDFDVKARGTASLIAKEVRAQQLNEFSTTIASDPANAPYIKRHKLLLQQAEALELTDVIMTEEEWETQQSSEAGKKMAKMQDDLAAAQLAEQQAKAAKLMAESEVAMTKVKEMMANIEKIVADTVASKVETIFAALQAGGVATRDPLIAPAGDEILKSAGYKDVTPDPGIAQLNGPPVQGAQATQRLMGKGETFAEDPRVPGAAMPADTVPADPGPAPGAVEMPDANTGQRAGIETPVIE